VGDAWLRVEEKGGAAGAGGVTIAQFKGRVEGGLLSAVESEGAGVVFPRAGPVGIPKQGRPAAAITWWGAYQQQRRPAGGSAIRR
jgi:hypothetical protein